jgi:drug/metabolite transporter (DMT)-like permease
MLYLILAIALNVIISSLFKLFSRYPVDIMQAVVVNYIVCVVTGCIFIGEVPFNATTFHARWFPASMIMGATFIAIFNLLAYGIKVLGMTTATIANKLALVIPALMSVLLYHEQVGIGKVAGIVLAFPAIYLATKTDGETRRANAQHLLLTALIFFGGGGLDTAIKYVQATLLVTDSDHAHYALFCFAFAALFGCIIVAVMLALKKTVIKPISILAGIAIGIPNYFSIYYIIRMLNSNVLQSSAAIPVFNIAIVVLSSLTAILLFREKANSSRLIGLALSIVAILLIAFGDK